jgi:hypothetical protein
MPEYRDPMEFVDRLDALMEAVELTCPHCEITTTVIDAGRRHVLGVTHQPGCPDYNGE